MCEISGLGPGRELAVEQINFRDAVDCTRHSGLLYKLRDVGFGNAVFVVIVAFLNSKVHKVVADGARSENVMVVSGFPYGSVLGPLLFFFLHTSDLPVIQENIIVGYADDSTLLDEVP